jgi:hypothetical protein
MRNRKLPLRRRIPGAWLGWSIEIATSRRPKVFGRVSAVQNITEILAALDRSTVWLGPARSVSGRASASRMNRLQRSAKGIRS